jgi:hypothetical protein
MPRKNRRPDQPRTLNVRYARASARTETKRGHRFEVRKCAESRSTYVCAGCQRIIPIGTITFAVIDLDHILGVEAGIDARRHWHLDCWNLFR